MNGHEIALWAGVAAFFGSLLAIGVFDLLSITGAVEFLGSLIVAAITAGSVHSKQRLDDAKAARDADGPHIGGPSGGAS